MGAAMRTSFFVLTTAIVSCLASHAYADPEPHDRRDDSRIGATVGLFTPTGELGVEYTQALHPNFELGVGVGYGIVRTGPQLSLMPRARLRRGPATLSLGAGLSIGEYNGESPFADPVPNIQALFGNAEAGLQVTSKWGPFARVFAGAGKIVAHAAYESSEQADQGKDVIPYGGLTVGWAF